MLSTLPSCPPAKKRLSVCHIFDFAGVILCLFFVVDGNEEEVAVVLGEGLAAVFVFDLLQGTLGSLVVLQLDHQGWDVGRIWNQDEVGIAFAGWQLFDKVAGVGVEIGKADGTLLVTVLVVVVQRYPPLPSFHIFDLFYAVFLEIGFEDLDIEHQFVEDKIAFAIHLHYANSIVERDAVEPVI